MANQTQRRLAQGLGWFSFGLGLAELIAPDAVAGLIGVRRKHRRLLRMFGAREIAAGIGIFTSSKPAVGVWSRVAGDALDLGALGLAYRSRSADKTKLAIATASVAGVTGLDLYCAWQLSRENGHSEVRMQSITVNRSPEEVYRFWRDFENLPGFMSHLESVQKTEGNKSLWVAKGLGGMKFKWNAEIIEDKPNEFIAWRSLKGSDVDNSGHVYFRPAPGGRGTEVHAQIEYNPPGGKLGSVIAGLFGKEPGEQLKGDLKRFKQVMETGEVVHSDASIHEGMYPGQPPEEIPGNFPESHWTH